MNMRRIIRLALLATFGLTVAGCGPSALELTEHPWARHAVDNTARGADGARLADANGDGLLDIATPWEEAGLIRLYLNPGPDAATDLWPRVTVGHVGSPEDAVLVDLDGDGRLDVVSACEGKTRSIFVHWAPHSPDDLLAAGRWTTEALPAAHGRCQWMYTLPLDVNADGRVDLVAGAKNDGARIGWFEAPPHPRNLNAWTWHPMREAGWIMSLVAEDMDADGDADILASDRKGHARGVFWLENPGPGHQIERWPEHPIGGDQDEVMFLTIADLDQDGRRDVLAANAAREVLWYRCVDADSTRWVEQRVPFPKGTGTGKGIAVGDIDGNTSPDIVLTCEAAAGRFGVFALGHAGRPFGIPIWGAGDIGGLDGTKFDLVELIDLDADGDLDVLTCEERENLGVIWYENPLVR